MVALPLNRHPLARIASQQAKFFAVTLSLVLWSTVFNGASLTPSQAKDSLLQLPQRIWTTTNTIGHNTSNNELSLSTQLQHDVLVTGSFENQTTEKSWVPSCTETKTLALQSVKRPDFDRHQQELATFLKGPGLVRSKNETTIAETSHATAAVCKFVASSTSKHFPHALQQLYRCWSWWRTHSNLLAILAGPAHHRGFRDVQRPDLFTWMLAALETALNDPHHKDEEVDYRNLNHTGTRRFQIVPLSEKDTTGDDELSKSNQSLLVAQPSFDHGDKFAFASPQHALELRTTLRSTYRHAKSVKKQDNNAEKRDWKTGCPAAAAPTTTRVGTGKHDHDEDNSELFLPRIAILNRDHATSKRSLLNAADMADHLQRALLPSSSSGTTPSRNNMVSVVHFEDRSFAEQLLFWDEHDIVISPHGAQLVGIPFLPTCGGVLEVFPTGLYMPYYFGSLAETSGVAYATLYLTMNDHGDWKSENAQAQANQRTRFQARGRNLCPNITAVVEATQSMIQNWRTCCRGMYTNSR